MPNNPAHRVYLALGSNLGDRLQNLRAAVENLGSHLQISRCSRVFETPPWGFTDQPAFLNMALEASTSLQPKALLKKLKKLEKQLGRQPGFRNGPRLIDMDILFYDDLGYDQPGLVIPHPRLHERGFVLVPLAEITPDFIHPSLHQSVNDLLAKCDTQGITPFTTEPMEIPSK